MNNFIKPELLVFIFITAILLMMPVSQAGSSTIEFPIDVEYSGGSGSSGLMPWATATFQDSGPNSVTLTMSALNLVDDEFISVWLFNFNPVLDPTLLNFSAVGIPGSTPNSINTGINAFKAGSNKFYDIEFDFPPPKGNFADKFTAGETVVYDITYSGTGMINAFSFNFQSDPGTSTRNSYHAAAHIQGIGSRGESGWASNATVVPEPVSSLLFLSGGTLFGLRRLRKKTMTV